MTGPVRVLVVDDHPLVRQGLRAAVEAAPDLTVAGEAADGDEVLAALDATPADVVLMDLSMPRVDGVEATRAVTGRHPSTRVLVLTSFAERERVLAAVDAGAVGYLLKDSEPAAVLDAIRAAAAGQSPLDPRVAGALLPRRGDATTAAAPQPRDAEAGDDPAAGLLSAREREVLALVARGLANKQIARELGISERTVKAHVGHVLRALGVAERTSAALWARDHGIG